MNPRSSRLAAEENRYLRRRGNVRVRRQRWRRGLGRRGVPILLLLAGIGGGGAFLAQARSLLADSDWFRVRRVTFQNRRGAPAGDLESIAEEVLSKNLFRVDLGLLREQIEAHPWVRAARVRRVLPDAVHVVLNERTPMAIASLGAGRFLVDADGVRLGAAGAADHLPLLTGLPGDENRQRRRIRDAAALVGALAARYPRILAGVGRIDLQRADAIDLVPRGGGPRLRMPPRGGVGMLPSYLRMRERIEKRFPAPYLVDLRWREQISVTPSKQKEPTS